MLNPREKSLPMPTTKQEPVQPPRPMLYRIFLVFLPWIAFTVAIGHALYQAYHHIPKVQAALAPVLEAIQAQFPADLQSMAFPILWALTALLLATPLTVGLARRLKQHRRFNRRWGWLYVLAVTHLVTLPLYHAITPRLLDAGPWAAIVATVVAFGLLLAALLAFAWDEVDWSVLKREVSTTDDGEDDWLRRNDREMQRHFDQIDSMLRDHDEHLQNAAIFEDRKTYPSLTP